MDILSKPINKLNLISDYYKAVFHLVKYPGPKTEKALLGLVQNVSNELPVCIARRKAIEGLARLKCKAAIPSIGECLKSSDPYLVESAAWALKELECKDFSFQVVMHRLLDDPRQNRRALIKSLSGLNVVSSASRINSFLSDESISVGIRGAAIAAMSELIGDKTHIKELEKHLKMPNQTDRYCAVMDVIDAGAIELLPVLLKLPLPPFYKLLAMDKLWPNDIFNYKKMHLFGVLNSIVKDNPEDLQDLYRYDHYPSNEFLVEELFSVDFSRCYLAAKILSRRDLGCALIPLRMNLERAKKDYGALYFFILLFRLIIKKTGNLNLEIEDLCHSALKKTWPEFMKFKPIAIYTLIDLFPERYLEDIPNWLDSNETRFWISRYACLLAIKEKFARTEIKFPSRLISDCNDEPHRFVKAKLLHIKEEHLR